MKQYLPKSVFVYPSKFHQIDYTYALYICVDSMTVAILKAFSRGEIQKLNNSQ